MKYREDLELVLKDVNPTIKPGEKIGIVGRTGAGKRIIPQEPTMFEGPFRQNLDPPVKCSIEDMWSTLIKCGTVKNVQPKEEKLETGWAQSHGLKRNAGDSFSDGQLRIFGLCRLLMRNRKIVVLDEATANVGLETDKHMQELIRSEIKDCTVLTIAHRLETIMNSDWIIVMDNGGIAEIGSTA
ncbi:Multidrug resistance-associated protein 5, partial [Coemansia sp. RSA 2559]